MTRPDEKYDYVIVGAGSAGCALAARLSEDPDSRVALVEAGEPYTGSEIGVPAAVPRLFGSPVDWAFTTVEQKTMADRAMYWPRGRTLGGSSSINFQMWVPGHNHDFDSWPRAAGDLWSWEAVAPYFRKAERWAGEPDEGAGYGSTGPLWISPPNDPDPTTLRFIAACGELGLPPVAGGLGVPVDAGAALTPLNQRNGARWSSADGYLLPAMARDNLRVFTGTLVRGITFDSGRATGVALAGGHLDAAREVILSAGTVGSAQLLQLSGIGDTDELRRVGVRPRVHLPGVGRNLKDHLTFAITMTSTVPLGLMELDSPANLARYEKHRRGPLTSNLAEAVALFRGDGGSGPPDLELIWTPVAFTEEAPGETGVTVAVVLLQPRSSGKVSLADADPESAPLIDPAYLSVDSDLTTLTAGVRFAERLFETRALEHLTAGPMAPWQGPVDDDVLRTMIRQRAETCYHPVGTCRMGTDPQAVVDERLRVREVDGLRVVDASVIPDIPRGHTHATATMLAERAADLIREDART